jgi:hypothetical protein
VGHSGAQDVDQSLALARGALRGSIVLPPARRLGLLLLSLMIVGWPQGAFAYRPFDSTDPAVADPGELEIEFSPVSFRRGDSGETWIAPQLKVNYGIAPNWEFVIEGQGEHPQFDGASSVMVDNAVFLKHVVREGTLQEQEGLSIAIEFGALLPGINDESGLGAEVAGIVGNQWDWGAIYFTAAAALTRDGHSEMFLGTIIEGPFDWPVRPVAELVYEREFGTSTEVFAGLAGVIWEAREGLAFDLAVRQAAVDGEPETEIRVGLTFAFSTR